MFTRLFHSPLKNAQYSRGLGSIGRLGGLSYFSLWKEQKGYCYIKERVPHPQPQPMGELLKFDASGAWRAFVREQSLGTSGRPDIKAISVLYAALPDSERQRLSEIGAVATEVW